MRFPQSGGCQCGAVRYEITAAPTVVYVCHCRECQRQSGAAFAMAAVMPREQFRITRGEAVNSPRTGDSGRTMLCWFCGACGTRLYHSPAGLAQNCNLKPGTLDDTTWLRPSVHVWTRSRQPWVQIPPDATSFETQPEDRSWLTRRPDGLPA
ncbi:MAG TPA: GFA family protein [Acetobacteraceae bacterium]|nr:GFA family protein [Acetobacteraceae bacterium]